MATIINISSKHSDKNPLHKEILKKYAKAGRNPEKAIDAMYGLWEGKNITIDGIRETKRRKKW